MSDELRKQIEDLEREADARRAWLEGKPVECRRKSHSFWCELSSADGLPFGPSEGYEHRRKPTPARRPWSKPEDVPGPVCWLRWKTNRNDPMMVIGFTKAGIHYSGLESVCTMLWMQCGQAEHSTDRKTWAPCEVAEVA